MNELEELRVELAEAENWASAEALSEAEVVEAEAEVVEAEAEVVKAKFKAAALARAADWAWTETKRIKAEIEELEKGNA